MKYCISFLFILGSLFCEAQYVWTEAYVILKNGESHYGQAKLNQRETLNFSEKLIFRKDKESKTIKYRTKEIEEVMFTIYKHEFADDAVYRSNTDVFFVPVLTYTKRNLKKYNLMQEIVSGDVSLYSRNIINNTSSTVFGNNYSLPINTSIKSDEEQELWLAKTDEVAMKLSSGIIRSILKKKLLRYFDDCPAISEDINSNDLVDTEDIEKLVIKYNMDCGY